MVSTTFILAVRREQSAVNIFNAKVNTLNMKSFWDGREGGIEGSIGTILSDAKSSLISRLLSSPG